MTPRPFTAQEKQALKSTLSVANWEFAERFINEDSGMDSLQRPFHGPVCLGACGSQHDSRRTAITAGDTGGEGKDRKEDAVSRPVRCCCPAGIPTWT